MRMYADENDGYLPLRGTVAKIRTKGGISATPDTLGKTLYAYFFATEGNFMSTGWSMDSYLGHRFLMCPAMPVDTSTLGASVNNTYAVPRSTTNNVNQGKWFYYFDNGIAAMDPGTTTVLACHGDTIACRRVDTLMVIRHNRGIGQVGRSSRRGKAMGKKIVVSIGLVGSAR